MNGQLFSETTKKLAEILIMALEIEYITIEDVEKRLSTSHRTARRYISVLMSNGYLEPEGGTKNKRYRICRI